MISKKAKRLQVTLFFMGGFMWKDGMNDIHYRIIPVIFLIMLSAPGCMPGAVNQRIEETLSIAGQNNFHPNVFSTRVFNIFTFSRVNPKRPESTLHVYIEGDGYAWQSPTRLSSNPTPINPTGFKLALADRSGAVVYIARPCQYLEQRLRKNCTSKYWSSHRYASEVIDAMNDVIDQVKALHNKANIGLTGFSGGGTVAAIMAAKRTDVQWLITVSANLDHEAWTAYHDDTPLSGSLNAINFVDAIRELPQVHYSGELDAVVPFSLNQPFIEKLGGLSSPYHQVIPGFDHQCCWAENWHELQVFKNE